MPSLPPGHLKLAQRIRGKLATSAAPMRTFWATVTAVSAGPPPTVTLQQGTLTEVSGIRYNPAYTPTVGDTVWGRAVGKDYLVEGSLDPASSGSASLTSQAKVTTSTTNLSSSYVTVLFDTFAVGTWLVWATFNPFADTGAGLANASMRAVVTAGTATLSGPVNGMWEGASSGGVGLQGTISFVFRLTVTVSATLAFQAMSSSSSNKIGSSGGAYGGNGYTALKIA